MDARVRNSDMHGRKSFSLSPEIWNLNYEESKAWGPQYLGHHLLPPLIFTAGNWNEQAELRIEPQALQYRMRTSLSWCLKPYSECSPLSFCFLR